MALDINTMEPTDEQGDCPNCDGTGESSPGWECSRCGGFGWLSGGIEEDEED